MRFVSTRGQAAPRDFAGVLLAGLAEDGGLFVPETLPHLPAAEWRSMRNLPYPELAARVIKLFAGDCLTLDELRGLCAEAFADFDRPAVVPLVQLDAGLWVQELFHGPTLAFKDLALQVLGRLFERQLARTGQWVTIVGATSGDTGPAALAACADRVAINIVMLHPQDRTSEVQRLQMTTVAAANVLNIAVQGTFDDCQDLVKAMFADAAFRAELHLSAVNSINWARIAAQVPYYVFAALALGAPDREISFSVPTGNFGNVLSAWVARGMGLPIRRLVVASNQNDILVRFIERNDMTVRPVQPSVSPSMDIQVSSNFERLLFELLDRDAAATSRAVQNFRATGTMDVPEPAWRALCEHFCGFRQNDAETLETMAELRTRYRYPADPHSAIAIAAARQCQDPGTPIVAMATAHEAKFREAVRQATQILPDLPPRLAALYDRAEHVIHAPADLAAIQAKVRAFAKRTSA
jgi:threonine synthase